jgi:hypothetical protein
MLKLFLNRHSSLLSRLLPWFGLVLILAYWWSIHPLGFSMGYVEDLCTDMMRQLMAHNLDQYGGPAFRTDQFLAPFGASVPYMSSWSIERDWIGAYAWKMNPQFPYLWVYFGVSLLFTYLGVAYILKKMKLSKTVAWSLATAVVLLHIPRHFKIWHHFEHLPQHWFYLSLFLDAWIWQKFWRERKWSLSLELWRGVLALGVFLSAGYFWGAMVLEWLVVRGCILVMIQVRRSRKEEVEIQFNLKESVLPFVLGCGLFAIELRWFLSLYEEVKELGGVLNNVGWFAFFYVPFRPLWWDRFFPVEKPFYTLTETVTSIGWFLIIPLFFTFSSLRKKRGGPGFGSILPFFIYILIAYTWQCRILSLPVINFVREIIPFLEFFRVGTRWSLLMPAIIGVIIALSWSDLSRHVKAWFSARPRNRVLTYLFIVSSVIEVSWLLHSPNMLPPVPENLAQMLEQIRTSPGDTVLDLPFCVAGGNGICTAEQCPNYPASTVGQCLRMWHDKKVYGLYQARNVAKHCEPYRQKPYQSWFSAWSTQRCFSDSEWKDFCSYLSQHPETSAVLLYPDVWIGAGQTSCLDQFKAHLGEPLQEVVMPRSPSYGGHWNGTSRVIRYRAQCSK